MNFRLPAIFFVPGLCAALLSGAALAGVEEGAEYHSKGYYERALREFGHLCRELLERRIELFELEVGPAELVRRFLADLSLRRLRSSRRIGLGRFVIPLLLVVVFGDVEIRLGRQRARRMLGRQLRELRHRLRVLLLRLVRPRQFLQHLVGVCVLRIVLEKHRARAYRG